MPKGKHPKKEVRDAIEYAEERGWRVVESGGGHVYCTLLCPLKSREGHRFFVHSTPQNPGNHAKRLKDLVDKCEHDYNPQGEEEI